MMHFRFIYESSMELKGPGEIMRYYRVLRGFSVRQLADMLHIVPATVLAYEQERSLMPYETAVAVTDALQIPNKIIFDDFCAFIRFPYTERLQITRNEYKLSQFEFADRAGISFDIYSKWESGYRRPSRKMYLKLKAVYPEI